MTEHAELELAHSYAARTMDAAAKEAFEDHLVGCAACQAEVRLATGLRRVMRDERAPTSIRPRWLVGVPVLVAAAAVIGFIVVGGVDKDVTALGAVKDPPAYVGLTVRAAPARGDSLFTVAMNAYVARQYDDAVHDLAAALRAGVDSIPATFFLASAQLMSGHHREAAENYGRVIAAGPAAASYLGEARLFRARALLRRGRADEALADLQAIGVDEPDAHQLAGALADSVQRVIRR